MLSAYYLCFIFILLCATVIVSQSLNKTIPLNKTLTYDDKELYGGFIYLNQSSTLQVNFSNVSETLSFIIFQVHSHLYNVHLYKTENVKEKSVSGTNVGLYSSAKGGLETFYINNPYNDKVLKLLISVHGYTDADPIPGGCNMEFDNPISPYMKATTYNKTYIIVEAPPPQSKSDQKCPAGEGIKTEFKMLYLPQNNEDADVYFDGIRKMLTSKNFKLYGRTIPQSAQNYWTMRRMLSAYPGNGAIYVAYSYHRTPKNVRPNYSVYVPTHSYGCSLTVEYDCELLDDSLTMLLNASLIFIGTFICYFGHRFFKMQLLIIGLLSGFIVTYILLSLMFNIDGPALVVASALSGLCVGAIRVVCWWIYGIPVFIIVLSAADIGFLIASILYYVSLGEMSYQIFLVDFNFWCLFILIMLLITICLVSTSYIASLICCAVVGSYMTIYPLDYCLGSNLKYILNNTIRRATVPDFNKAVIMPSFQWRDWFLSFVWLTLATTGFSYQYYYNKGRPPFPPPPRSVRAVPEYPVESFVAGTNKTRTTTIQKDFSRDFDENTPLLS